MKIKDKMTKYIITANTNSNINDISKLMKKYDIGFIPISQQNKIIGVITDRDIIVNEIYNNDYKLENYISKNIISADENQNIENALDIMKEHKIKRLLVTNNQKVTGIISISDLLNDIDSNTLLNALKEIYQIDKNNHDFNSNVNNFYL